MKDEKNAKITRFIRQEDPHQESKESYCMASARYKVSLYQKRMMICIVEATQPDIYGKYRKGQEIKVVTPSGDPYNPVVQIPMHLILQDEDSNLSTNLEHVKKSAKALLKNVIEYKDHNKNWIAFVPIIGAHIPPSSSVLNLQVHHKFWNALLNFKRGERSMNTRIAIALKSVYAMRFYELLGGKTDPITYSVEELKAMFGLQDKYKQINDFIRKVIEPSKRELDESAPYSFTYTPIKTGKKITSIRFTPVYHQGNDDEVAERKELMKHVNVSSIILDRNLRDFLMKECGFTSKGLLNEKNRPLFQEAQVLIPNLYSKIQELAVKADEAGAERARYIVGALKNILKEIKSTDVGSVARKSKVGKPIRVYDKKSRYADKTADNLSKISDYLASHSDPNLNDIFN